MDERMSPNERKVIDKVDLLQYYNQVIVPLTPQFNQRSYGVPVKFSPMVPGRDVGICPFHQDTDPSLRARPQFKRYRCFGCGAGGTVVQIHRRLRREYFGEKLTVEQALEQLARLFNITLDRSEEGNKVKNAFERAREVMTDTEMYREQPGRVSLGEFRRVNNRARQMETLTARVKTFADLDLVASVQLSSHAE